MLSITNLTGNANENCREVSLHTYENAYSQLLSDLSEPYSVEQGNQTFQNQYDIVKVLVAQSCLTFCDPRLLCPWDFPGKNTGVGCHFLLQCIKSET